MEAAPYLATSFFGSSNAKAPDAAWERMLEHCLYPTLAFIPPLIASYCITVLIFQKYTNWKGLKLQKLAGQLSMYPAFVGLIWYSHATLIDYRYWQLDNYQLRQDTSTVECDLFANLYIACNIVQAIGQMQTERPPLLHQLMGHHVLSILCYTSGFYFDRFRWWTAFAGVCELTNLFLVPVFACKEYFPEWKVQVRYIVSVFVWCEHFQHLVCKKWLHDHVFTCFCLHNPSFVGIS